MPLIALNLTAAPLALAAGAPVPTLQSSGTAGLPGPAYNVTANLRGLSAPNFALVEAQRAAGSVKFAWVGLPEYGTQSLQVSAPMQGGTSTQAGSATVAEGALEDVVIYADAALGDDANPGTAQRPVRTFDRAWALLQPGSKRLQVIDLAASATPYAWASPVLHAPKVFGPYSSPIFVQGKLTNELGDRTASAGGTTSLVVDSSLGATIRSGSTAAIVAGAPAGQVRIQGLAGLLATDPGRKFMFRMATQRVNNRTLTMATFIDATQADFYTSNAVTGDASNGAIYWQESFRGSSLMFKSTAGGGGANAGQRRKVRAMATDARGTVTCVDVASSANNDNFTATGLLPDNTTVAVTFEYKVDGGFVPVGGRVPIDISALGDPSAAGVAAATAAVLAAQAIASFPVWSTNAAGSAVVKLRQRFPGSAGNVAITKGAGAFAVAGFSGALGSPLISFVVNATLGAVPGVGATFQIQKPACTISYANGVSAFYGSTIDAAGSSVWVRGVKFESGLASNNNLFVSAGSVWLEASEIAGKNSSGVALSFGEHAAGLHGASFRSLCWQDAIETVLGTLPAVLGGAVPDSALDATLRPVVCSLLGVTTAPRYQDGCDMHDMSANVEVTPGKTLSGYWILSNLTVRAVSTYCRFESLDGEGARLLFQNGAYLETNQAGRLAGSPASTATLGLLHLIAAGASPAALDVDDSSGDAWLLDDGSNVILQNAAAYGGDGNAGYGVRALNKTGAIAAAAASTMTVSGATGDLKVGLLAVRPWSDFYNVSPQGNQSDYKGDGARVATAASTASMP